MAEDKFRKESLERLSSPEQLDFLMKVTTPKGWLALLALGVLQTAIILWGFFGSIPTRVEGQGILVKSGGVFEVVSMASGQIAEIYADEGEIVKKGQIVARIFQPDIVKQIKKLKAGLVELKAEHRRIVEFCKEDIRINVEHMKNQRANIKQAIGFANDRLKWLTERLKTRSLLLKQGLITRQVFVDTKQEINTTRQEIEKKRNMLKEVSIQEFKIKEQKKRQQVESEQIINQNQRELAGLLKFYQENSRVISSYSGRILEITADQGSNIDKGESVMSLELVGKSIKTLEAVVYVPSMDGKKVRPGMRAHISPSTVKREEYGFMFGIVTHVAEFPSTTEGMMRILQNESLVQTLSRGEAPIQIYTDLIPDPRTESGFKWSSPKGPPLKIQSGTICAVTITISEQSPISLVIPFFNRVMQGS